MFKSNLEHNEQLFDRLAKDWENIKQKITNLSLLPINVRRNRANEILDRIYTNIKTNISDGSSPSVYSYIMANKQCYEEFLKINGIIQRYKNAYTTSRQNLVSEYFRKKFAQTDRAIIDINFARKHRGVQLGDIITIKYLDANQEQQEIKFFVKTHQSGSRQTGEIPASNTKAVNPKELLIYKFFEYTGFGPKTHFIIDPTSIGGFYIVTQDVEFTKFPTRKTKIFKRYDQLADHYDSLMAANTDQIAEEALTRIDIFSRILSFTDMNRDNFGRVTIISNAQDQTRFKWKIIDFRAPGIGFYEKTNIVFEFMHGNTQYNYTGFQAYLLTTRSKKKKITIALQIFQEFKVGKQCCDSRKMPILPALNRSLTEVKDYVQKNARVLGLEQDVSGIFSGLDQYVKQVTKNYHTLKQGIKNEQQKSTTQEKQNIISQVSLFKANTFKQEQPQQKTNELKENNKHRRDDPDLDDQPPMKKQKIE